MKAPDPVIAGLMFCIVVVLGLVVAFFEVYRRHLRNARRASRGLDPLSSVTTARRRPAPFQMPTRWLAVRSTNTSAVTEACGSKEPAPAVWSEALSRARERTVFVSAPVDGWTLMVGAGLPDPSVDADRLYHFLRRVSGSVGEAHFFSSDRVLNFHAWARLDDGRVTRAYAWAGDTLWNEGRMTLEERELGFICRAYGEEPEPVRYGEAPPEMHNTERVILLARRWSIDPLAATEILLQQEAVESGGDDEEAEQS